MRKRKYQPPFETDELRTSLTSFFESSYDDPISGEERAIGSFRWGVYIFYDYDDEPIYVGQTCERISSRIGRHLTNQRTDAVAMSVLDPFEVFEIEVYPLPQFQEIKNKKDPRYKPAKAHLDALEYEVHRHAVAKSAFKAILNEKDPPTPKTRVKLPKALRGKVVSEDVSKLRSHADVRIARRAQIISRLSQTIAERQVQIGLRRTLVTQAERLRRLAETRFHDLGGEGAVEKGNEGSKALETEEN